MLIKKTDAMKAFLFGLLLTVGLINLDSMEAQTLIGKIANKLQQTISKSTNDGESKELQVRNNHNTDGAIQQNMSPTHLNTATDTASLPNHSVQNEQADVKNEGNNLSIHETSSWKTIDSVDFQVKYPDNWNISTNGTQIDFSPPQSFPNYEFDLHLSIVDYNSLYGKTYQKEAIRFLEAGPIITSITQVNYGLHPNPIVDSVVKERLYKDFTVDKYIYDNIDRKSETDIYAANRTISIGYAVSQKLFNDYKEQIEAILKSFELKLNGNPLVANKRKIIEAHNNIDESNTKSEVAKKAVAPAAVYKDDEKIYDKVEINPQFAGGNIAWEKTLEQSLDTSILEDNKAPKGKYTVIVSFIVYSTNNDRDNEVKALNDPGYGTAQEAVRFIKFFIGRWRPAMNNGNYVNCRFKKAITFEVH